MALRIGLTTARRSNAFLALVSEGLTKRGVPPVAVIKVGLTPARVVDELLLAGWGLVPKRTRRHFDDQTARDQRREMAAALQRVHVPSVNVCTIAQNLSCPVVRVPDLRGAEAAARIGSLNLDLLMYCGGGIVGPAVLAAPSLGVVNGHAGPLPEVRGMSAIEWAALTGHRLSVTAHYMVERVDRGSVVGERLVTDPVVTTGELRGAALVALSSLMADAAVSPTPRTIPDPTRGRTYYRLHPRMSSLVERSLSASTRSRVKEPPRL